MCAAVQRGHKDVVEILLEAKADPDQQNKVFLAHHWYYQKSEIL